MIGWLQHYKKYFRFKVGGEFMSSIVGLGDDVPFEMRLAETIVWCQSRVRLDDPRGSLRSAELQPKLLSDTMSWTVHSVVLSRSSNVRDQKVKPITSSEQLAGGKLLICFPDEEVWDGASESASRGFFDRNDAPAWDTWVALFD